ncbi:MAG: hypothetical protein WAS54_03990 [Scrofimicrobium sp.]
MSESLGEDPVQTTCRKGHPVLEGQKFCTTCGEKLDEEPPLPEESGSEKPDSPNHRPWVILGSVLAGALLVVLIVWMFGNGAGGEATEPSGYPEATEPRTTEEQVYDQCVEEYVWAVDLMVDALRTNDNGFASVQREWGSEDGRVYRARDFSLSHTHVAVNDGNDAANQATLDEVSAYCWAVARGEVVNGQELGAEPISEENEPLEDSTQDYAEETASPSGTDNFSEHIYADDCRLIDAYWSAYKVMVDGTALPDEIRDQINEAGGDFEVVKKMYNARGIYYEEEVAAGNPDPLTAAERTLMLSLQEQCVVYPEGEGN